MNNLWQNFKQHFWPISAIIFCPCHLPLTMSAVASLSAGTVVGSYMASYYNSIESVLAVTFSFYFVIAFMIWVVRGPQQREGTVCVIDAQGNTQLSGLSTKNIVVWGLIGMFIAPALVSVSFFAQTDIIPQAELRMLVTNMEYNSGLIWLLSITVVVMIPVMAHSQVWGRFTAYQEIPEVTELAPSASVSNMIEGPSLFIARVMVIYRATSLKILSVQRGVDYEQQ